MNDSILEYPFSWHVWSNILHDPISFDTHNWACYRTHFLLKCKSMLHDPHSLDIQDQVHYRTHFLFTCKIKYIVGPTFCWLTACCRTHFVFTFKIKHVTGPSFLDIQNRLFYNPTSCWHITEPLALHDQAHYRACTRFVSNNIPIIWEQIPSQIKIIWLNQSDTHSPKPMNTRFK